LSEISINCKISVSDLSKRKIKELTNVAIIEDPLHRKCSNPLEPSDVDEFFEGMET
jgi:hypothetical protein